MRLFTLPSTLQVGTKEDAYKKSYLFIDICFGLFTINTAAVYISNYALRSILYLRIWKHGMVFNLLSTRRYLKQKLRAKVVHFLDSFLKHTGQIFHWRNSSRCKSFEKRKFLFKFADVHGLSAVCPLLCSGQHRRRADG